MFLRQQYYNFFLFDEKKKDYFSTKTKLNNIHIANIFIVNLK